jgi:membrane dipeptidase
MTNIQTGIEKSSMITIDALSPDIIDRNYLKELKKGGVTVVHTSRILWESAREALSLIGKLNVFLHENNDLAMLIREGEDILRAKDEGKVGILLGAQNSSLIEDELALVEVFNNLGLKVMQLTYNNQNLVGSGCYETTDNGISRFGKLVISEMNRVGMVIDLSHCADRTTMEAIDISRRPVAITHANPQWIYATKRSKSKEVLGKLRDNKGMLGLTLFPTMIGGSESSIEDFCELVARTVDFMGIEHVGLGSDLTVNLPSDFLNWARMGRWTHEMEYGTGSPEKPGLPTWPAWFKGPADFPNLAEGLYKRGFSDKDVRAIMGENWLTFFTEGFKTEEK